jgi:hypothetical protein
VRGVAGGQGVAGETGLQGSTTAGIAGPTGGSGVVGKEGSVGATGNQGPAGIVGSWASYREFWFDGSQDTIRSADASKVPEIAAYLKLNPSLKIGIDTFPNLANQDLRDRRVKAVSAALVQAGVPASQITTGAFGAVAPRRDSRVEVLITTSQRLTTMQN